MFTQEILGDLEMTVNPTSEASERKGSLAANRDL